MAFRSLAVFTASFSSSVVLAQEHSAYFKVDDYGYIKSSRWKDRLFPSDDPLLSADLLATRVKVSIPGYATVLGGVQEGSEYFLGMPYAQPPLGPLRFQPAQAIGSLDGLLNATQFCPSVVGASFMRQARHTTLPDDAKVRSHEDALCINIWRPRGLNASATALPIMVFIYGGGFVSGSSSNAWYDGKNIAQFQDRIVVTFNYRVGPLGFFSSEELVSNVSGTGAANGLLDQNLALKWVQMYGAAFGGDIGNVGLFGESAGALSVCSHVVSPLSAGLFKRAILESGPCNGPWGAGAREHGLAISRLLMSRLNCSTMECMRTLPASSLASWPYSFESNQSLITSWKLTPFPWEFPGYWVDDYFLPAEQYKLFQDAKINAEAMIIVGNSMDGFLTFLYPDTDYPTTCSKAGYANAQRHHWQHFSDFHKIADDVEKLYPCADSPYPDTPVPTASWQFALADRDYNIHCASNVLAQVLHSRGIPAWRATFAVGPRRYDQACLDGMIPCCQEGDPCYGWASHGAEIPFVFNTTQNACESESVCGAFVDPFSDGEPLLVRSMQEYWSSFLATGIPIDASGAGPVWPQATKGIATLTTPAITITSDNTSNRCDFWSNFYPGQSHQLPIVV